MAVQPNGITVASVDGAARIIRVLVGAADFRLAWSPDTQKFVAVGAWWSDGRRNAGKPYIAHGLWRQMMRQAHAIARDRGWKTTGPS